MKISLNWLKNYLDLPLDPEKIGDLLTSLGLEVEGMEKIEAGHNGLAGIMVGKVLTCEKHPDADRLSLCTVDIAGAEPLSIVCGAPNVAKGQKVLVATAGANVLGKDGEGFTIKSGKIRGAASEGMICAVDELGLGEDHSGILVLDDQAVVGMPAKEHLGLIEDWIYEIGLTPNRSDATNHIGVARDLYAALVIRHGFTGGINLPNVRNFPSGENTHPVQVFVENVQACPRYSGVSISGIKVGPSPEWLRQALTSIGERSINNVVDATNYILHEMGQPLHAFDLDKIGGQTIRVKTLPDQTPFLCLDEIERKLDPEDLMICDGDSQPMCIGGVFGGLHSGVTGSTTGIFLESAYFDPGFIRRSSTRHNLRTEAARIFEKGADPESTVYILERAAKLICELTGGQIASPVVDIYPNPVAAVRLDVRVSRVRLLTGVDLDLDEIRRVLAALGMPILSHSGDTFSVQVPGNKSDVLREVDVIEEILRVIGYDRVPEPGKMFVSVQTTPKPDPSKLRDKVASMLSARGFHEAMSLSLDQSARYEKFAPEWVGSLVKIHNTSNIHLDSLRADMMPNMLENVLRNKNRQNHNVRLFEFGKTYSRDGESFTENNRLILAMTGKREAESWLNSGREQSDLYTLKTEAESVLQFLRIQGWQERPSEGQGLEPGLVWARGPKEMVRMGAVSGEWLEIMDIDQPVWVADFNWDIVLGFIPGKDQETTSLSRFPEVRRDLALVLDQSVGYKEIEALALKTEKILLKEVNLFDVYTSEEHLGKGKKSCAVSFRFADPERTLTDQEIDAIMDKLITGYETKLGAVIRR
ncbi:MAG: phenylalanine--tRNA ligase subunit beta [Saprospiraceae bacterium]|nr:phenylalanine--tRNA ligase subunit beta [Saprospiraceae bacterium]